MTISELYPMNISKILNNNKPFIVYTYSYNIFYNEFLPRPQISLFLGSTKLFSLFYYIYLAGVVLSVIRNQTESMNNMQ